MTQTMWNGLHISKGSDWDAVNHPNEFTVGSVRTIIRTQSDKADDVALRIAKMQKPVAQGGPGKHVVVTVDKPDTWSNITDANWEAGVREFAQKVPADVWSIGNEPSVKNAAAVGGPFWPKMRSAAEIIRSVVGPSVPITLGAPFSDDGISAYYNNANSYFNGLSLDIRNFIDGFEIHLYSATPQANLDKVTTARSTTNAYSKPWTNLPIWVTEFGFSAWAPAGKTQFMVHSLPEIASFLTQTFNLMRDNRDSKKIGGVYWFLWQDLVGLKDGADGYMGIKKSRDFVESVNSPPAGVQPSPLNTSANGYRPLSKTALDALPRGYDLVAAPAPTAITDPAVNILQTQAGLRGRVNPNGTTTTRTFLWSKTPGGPYTETTGAQVTGSVEVTVQFSLTGLTLNTDYYYKTKAVSSAGTTLGSEVHFKTAAPPLAPGVSTGPVTTPTTKSAVLNGSVNPNGKTVTDYHFEWGTSSTALVNLTSAKTLPSGLTEIPVSAGVTGLTQGARIYYQLVATNSIGTTRGTIRNFIVQAPATGQQPDLTPITLLPLVLAVEIVDRDGSAHKLSQDAASIENRPQNLAFGTQNGDGFAESSFELYRKIDLRWTDLDLLNRVRYIGADGSIAYEGLIVGLPRSVDSDGERIQVQCSGLMSSSRDDPFTDVIVDRSADSWQNASLDLRKAYMDADVVLDTDYTAQVDSGSLHFKGHTNKKINGNSQSVLECFAPTGVKLKRFAYKGTEKRISPNVKPARLHADDVDIRTMGNWAEVIDLTMDGTLHAVSLQKARSVLGLRMCAHVDHGSATAPALPSVRRFDQVASYGDHDIELQDNGNEPEGVYGSDVISYLINQHCPLLNDGGVTPTSYVIEHLVFDEPTATFDAFTLINGYHLWHLGAYEDGTVIFRPYDLTTPDWLIKSTDRGVTLDVQGDTIDQFANGILVSYTDIDQRDQDLHPDDYADLRDDDPDNPANKAGIKLTTSIDISNPITRANAIAIGRAALLDFNRPKAPGTIKATSYVRDAAGIPQPGWRVRCGHTIAIQDQPFNGPRLITATNWDESGELEITVEQPPPSTDAIMARLQAQWDASGLT